MREIVLHLEFKASPMERRAWEAIKRFEARDSTSELVRELVREAAERRGLWPVTDQPEPVHQDLARES
jgi:hypothetical protein